ncbi:hypothetical protein A2U01_0107706, partial [Trifolium medium]|nr:hypothetical protein [Trifolium medium]
VAENLALPFGTLKVERLGCPENLWRIHLS